jgi:proteasome assembly chaperone (PAC2) family protein
LAVKLYSRPQLANSIMFCGWPGIGNIGLKAVDSLRISVGAELFGEIEPWDFFEPEQVIIKNGFLKDLVFPANRFFYSHKEKQDLLFFIGKQQPGDGTTEYAEGRKAFQMANLVLDVAEQFGCRRIYTSGAAVTQIHHTSRPRVWAVPNSNNLIEQIRQYRNTVLMSAVEGRQGQGVITGLNGLLLGAAKQRSIEAICLMGEIPYYLQAAPWPYPKASKSVLEVFADIIGIDINMDKLVEQAEKVQARTDELLEALYNAEGIPSALRDEIEKLKNIEPSSLGPITEIEQRRIMEHIDELFNQTKPPDEKHL